MCILSASIENYTGTPWCLQHEFPTSRGPRRSCHGTKAWCFEEGVSPASKSKPCENVISPYPTPSLQAPWDLSPLPKPRTQSVPGAEAGAKLPDCSSPGAMEDMSSPKSGQSKDIPVSLTPEETPANFTHIKLEVYEPTDFSIKDLILKKAREICICNHQTIITFFYQLFPVLDWLPRYNVKTQLLGDAISGILVGIVAIPQSIYGIYTNFFCNIIYVAMATSHHNSVGFFGVLCLMIGQSVNRHLQLAGYSDDNAGSSLVGNSHLATTSFQVVVDSDKVSPQPSFLQAEPLYRQSGVRVKCCVLGRADWVSGFRGLMEHPVVQLGETLETCPPLETTPMQKPRPPPGWNHVPL
ncbi:uncharacterized protein [Phaenicophaeus curvirostris]|uniref:uncharacterized protein n=1 Tax=Phaenicophaeus curvirostris TaxID=33595 RepID=UPI0037F0DA5D